MLPNSDQLLSEKTKNEKKEKEKRIVSMLNDRTNFNYMIKENPKKGLKIYFKEFLRRIRSSLMKKDHRFKCQKLY